MCAASDSVFSPDSSSIAVGDGRLVGLDGVGCVGSWLVVREFGGVFVCGFVGVSGYCVFSLVSSSIAVDIGRFVGVGVGVLLLFEVVFALKLQAEVQKILMFQHFLNVFCKNDEIILRRAAFNIL